MDFLMTLISLSYSIFLLLAIASVLKKDEDM